MKTRTLALLLGAALLLQGTTSAEAQNKLRWKLKKGQLLRLVVEQTATSETTIRQTSLKMSVRMGFEMDWNVKEVDDKGVARMEQTFTRVHMRMESPNVRAIVFDSASQGELSPQAKALAQSLVPLLNLTFHVAMNDRGAILDVQLPSSSKESLEDLPPQVKEIFSRQGLRRTLQQCAAELPEKELVKGKKWANETKGPTRLGLMTTKNEFTYVGDISREGKEVAQIDVAGTFSLLPPDPASTAKTTSKTAKKTADKARARRGKMSVKRQDLKGTMYFDPAAGLIRESQTDQTLVTETRKKDLVLETKSKTTMRMKLRVLK